MIVDDSVASAPRLPALRVVEGLVSSGFPEITAFTLERMTKRGTPPQKTLKKWGTLLFVDREVVDVHVVVGINPTAQQDICDSTVRYSSYH